MKIFVLLSRIPYPLEKGDKLRAFNQLKYLSAHHEIHLCALTDIPVHPDAGKTLKPYCKSLHFLPLPALSRGLNIFRTLFNGKPFQAGYFYNKKNQRLIDKLINDIKPDRIYCQLVRVAEYVKHQSIKKTLDYQDVFSKGVQRRTASVPFYMKPLLNAEFKRLTKYEADVFGFFDNKTIISFPDRNFIQHPEKEKITVIPNGVDLDFYKTMVKEKQYDIVFTGNMGYPPNINSVLFLVNDILPLVRKSFPDIKLLIAGAAPPPKILALKSETINVTGWVEDMRECYSVSKIFIAPMLIGTGLQNKLLEAMAMKLPCITSELANNALCAQNGKEILIGNTPAEYAFHIISLLNDEDKCRTLGNQGYLYVSEKYRWDAVNEKLNKLICG